MSAMKVTFKLPNAAYLMQSYKIPLPNASNSTFLYYHNFCFYAVLSSETIANS